MNKFLLGMTVVGTATNEMSVALADGKGTVGELAHGACAVAKSAANLTGKGGHKLYHFDGDVAGVKSKATSAGSRVAALVERTLGDGDLTVNDLVDLLDGVSAEVLDATGIGDRVVIDATAG